MKLVKTKVQIFNHDSSAIGPGKAQLLVAILDHGSISAAAKSMNMSYKRAWDLVTAMNNSFKEPLVITKTGGSNGGGAEITSFGLQVLSSYQDAIKNAECYINAQMSDLLQLLK
jgi:molybdate transport system regulatory protein